MIINCYNNNDNDNCVTQMVPLIRKSTDALVERFEGDVTTEKSVNVQKYV